jgi:site-specific DNA-cytosine methylase
MTIENKDKIILDLCGGTGSWSKPYKDAGYDVVLITLPENSVVSIACGSYDNGNSFLVKDTAGNSRKISFKDIYGILAAPPCTMFSIARTNAKTPRNTYDGMSIVNCCIRIIQECLHHNLSGLKFWALENPSTGYLKKFLGKPALVFQPYEYGDPYTKSTAIWGYFNEPKKKPVEALDFTFDLSKTDYTTQIEYYECLNTIPDGYREKTGYLKRDILRSMTPQGFANAFYKANR